MKTFEEKLETFEERMNKRMDILEEKLNNKHNGILVRIKRLEENFKTFGIITTKTTNEPKK